MSSPAFVIIQTGGKGTRLRPFTANKPKAMVSVKGMPLVLKAMEKFPEAHFLLTADYQKDVLQRYLAVFAKDYDYTVIEHPGEHSGNGIPKALDHIPSGTPFAILWCDLYFEGEVFPLDLDLSAHNYIGLSKTFPCRWSFKEGAFIEDRSDALGIAGVFSFVDKQALEGLPADGEFCKFLQGKGVPMTPFFLDGVTEIGTLEAYRTFTQQDANTRPFNVIEYQDDCVIKRPTNTQGELLARREKAWYREAQKEHFSFIPEVLSYEPLTLQRVRGTTLFEADLSAEEKRDAFAQVVENLSALHAITAEDVPNRERNGREAILDKTRKRLDSIVSVVPFSTDDTIRINGRTCLNFYKHWDMVEALYEPFKDVGLYRFIHGDLTFSNAMYDPTARKVFFIDPRGYYGSVELYGDPDYDWAKLYYSVVGNYDQFNAKRFELNFSPEGVDLSINSNGWDEFEDDLFEKSGASRNKVEFFHAIIWLSLASYAWDDYDSICGAFYNGMVFMQRYYEKTLQTAD